MSKYLKRLLSGIILVGAIFTAPFIIPKTQDQQPESEIIDDVEIVEESSYSCSLKDIELEEAIVQRVIDGDTIIADTDNEKDMRIRFIGIDTPESVHPDESKNTEEGVRASEFTEELIPAGTTIYLEKDISDTDPYDRYLRYIWLTDDIPIEYDIGFMRENMVNALLVDEGVADVATYEPDVKYVEIFEALAFE